MADLDPKRWPALHLASGDGVWHVAAMVAFRDHHGAAVSECDGRMRGEAFHAELDARTHEKQAEELDEAAGLLRKSANRLLPPGNDEAGWMQVGYRKACADAADFLEVRARWYRDGCPEFTAEQLEGAFAVDREVSK